MPDFHHAELERRQDYSQLVEEVAELRSTMEAHIAHENEYMPALKDMVALWRSSKILASMLTTLMAVAAGMWALFVWAKDHLK